MTAKIIQAAVCAEPGAPMELRSIELAPPADGEAQVQIEACAICQSDISYMDGHWGSFSNTVFGHEAVGIVTETGAGVTDLKAGDRVLVTLIRACGECRHCQYGAPPMCDHRGDLGPLSPLKTRDGVVIFQAMGTGAFADAVTVHRSQLVKVPKSIPAASAATVACAVITGYGAVVRDGCTKPGDRVVVVGAGGVGLNIIQTAKLQGAGEIIAVDREGEKLEDATRFGATHVINAATMDVADRIKFATASHGADQVYISVGAQGAIDAGMNYLGKSGSLVIVGIPADGAKTTFDTGSLNSFSQRIIGSKMGGARIEQDVPAIIDHYRKGEFLLDELVAKTYPLGEINEAIAASRTGKMVRNVLVPGR